MKKTLKLILTVLLSLALLSSFVACDGDDDKDSGKNDNSDSSVGGDDTGSTDNGGSTGDNGNGSTNNSGSTDDSGDGSTDNGGNTDDSESADINPYYSLEFTVVDGGYEVSGIGTCTDTDIVIPSTYNGLPVVSIGNWAFDGCDNITSVLIPDSVTDIEEHAFFKCDSLTSVIIGDSVTSIGEYAFSGCSRLTSVVIPSSIETIGSGAFRGCSSLTTVTFEGNSRLLSIGDYAFQNCHKLVEVINHSSLNITAGSRDYGRVAYYAIEVHTGESKIVNADDYLFNTYDGVNYLFGYVGDDADLVLPDSYNGESYVINNYAFYNCDSLTSVVIPNSVTSIGDFAFNSCDSLTSVVIPDSVTSIGDFAFNSCDSLTSVVIGDSVTSIIGDSAFYGCHKLVEVINHSSLDITAGSEDYGYVAYYAIEVHTGESKIVNVDDYLFYTYNGVNYLVGYVGNNTDLVLPDSYNGEKYVINQSAFYDCDSLASVVIPNSVTSIGNYAFEGCSNLTSVVIPDSVTSIGWAAFEGCSNLTSVVIPDSVTSIGWAAFEDCYNLTDVYYTGTTEEWAEMTIYDYNDALTSATIHYNYVPEK